MSFAAETETLVNQLIEAEYKNACEKWGEKYNSLHEGYAVLLEEVEEARNEFECFNYHFLHLWDVIKRNDKNSLEREPKDLTIYSICLIKELAQVGAVLMKFKNTLGWKNENIW